MCNDFLFVHFIIFGTVDGGSRKDGVQNAARTLSIDVRNRAGKLNVGSFQHLLQTVKLPGSVMYQALAVADQFAQLPLVPVRNIAWL